MNKSQGSEAGEQGALRAVIAHWDEFGPEHGFDETIDQARRFLASKAPAEAGSAPLKSRVYAWLGQWRDEFPAEAVSALQSVLGPLEAGSAPLADKCTEWQRGFDDGAARARSLIRAGSAPLALTSEQAKEIGLSCAALANSEFERGRRAGSAPLVLPEPAKMYEDPNMPVKCRQCGRKSWGHTEGSPCDFPQPDGGLCVGLFSRIRAAPAASAPPEPRPEDGKVEWSRTVAPDGKISFTVAPPKGEG